jgi:hypothetical protein
VIVIVGVTVAVGVVAGVYPLKEKDIPTLQACVGVGVGVNPILVTSNDVSSQLTAEEGVGVIAQSNKASKLKVLQLDTVGVGVGHIPLLNKFAEISGQSE